MATTDPDANADDLKVTDAFKPFSLSELEELRAFSQHVADLHELDLGSRKKLTLRIGLGVEAVEDVDRDRVGSLMAAYRKVALLEGEPGTFSKTRNMLCRHARGNESAASSQVLKWLRELKDARKEVLDEGQVLEFHFPRRGQLPKTVQPKVAIDALVNGVVAHSDRDARALWEDLGGWDSGPLLMMVLVAVAGDLAIFRGLDGMVCEVLDAPSLRADLDAT